MEVLTVVVTLLTYGCPVRAIVVAFGLDERTVASWLLQAGHQCQGFHEQLVQGGTIELEHVQADEMWVKRVGGKLWLAMALCVPSRLWLGGILSERRDRTLAVALVRLIRSCGTSLSLLVCTDGWKPYPRAFLQGFRFPVRSGQRGRPRLLLEEGFRMGQVVKQYEQYEKKRLTGVVHRVLRGTQEAIESAVKATNGGSGINTAFIERLNATFRCRLAPLARRTRNLARKEVTLQAGMFLVGSVYNFCAFHDSLLQATEGEKSERTPAMAAGADRPSVDAAGTLCLSSVSSRWASQKEAGTATDGPYQSTCRNHNLTTVVCRATIVLHWEDYFQIHPLLEEKFLNAIGSGFRRASKTMPKARSPQASRRYPSQA